MRRFAYISCYTLAPTPLLLPYEIDSQAKLRLIKRHLPFPLSGPISVFLFAFPPLFPEASNSASNSASPSHTVDILGSLHHPSPLTSHLSSVICHLHLLSSGLLGSFHHPNFPALTKIYRVCCCRHRCCPSLDFDHHLRQLSPTLSSSPPIPPITAEGNPS